MSAEELSPFVHVGIRTEELDPHRISRISCKRCHDVGHRVARAARCKRLKHREVLKVVRAEVRVAHVIGRHAGGIGRLQVDPQTGAQAVAEDRVPQDLVILVESNDRRDPFINHDAGSIKGDRVAVVLGQPADQVVLTGTGNCAEGAGKARDLNPDDLRAKTARAAGIRADEISAHGVVGSAQLDPLLAVRRDQVAVSRQRPADGVSIGSLSQGEANSVWQRRDS